MSMSTGERLELANQEQPENTVQLLDCLFGYLPSVPKGFGTMATTITIVRSSTTSVVKCHSVTCFASSKAIACSCPSKEDSSVGDLQWSSLPVTDHPMNGASNSEAKRASFRKASTRNSKGVSRK